MPHYQEADDAGGDGGSMVATGPSREAVKRMDQIISVSDAQSSYMPDLDSKRS